MGPGSHARPPAASPIQFPDIHLISRRTEPENVLRAVVIEIADASHLGIMIWIGSRARGNRQPALGHYPVLHVSRALIVPDDIAHLVAIQIGDTSDGKSRGLQVGLQARAPLAVLEKPYVDVVGARRRGKARDLHGGWYAGECARHRGDLETVRVEVSVECKVDMAGLRLIQTQDSVSADRK